MARFLPRLLLIAAAALAPAAIAWGRDEIVPVKAGSQWRAVATEDDRNRVRHWRDAWVTALGQANQANAAAIGAGGALFDPDAALPELQPAPGDYDCRTVKLGRPATGGMNDYVAYPVAHCRITMENGRLHFVKLDGIQRPAGTLFPDNGQRMVFLGTLVLGDEARALRYSRDTARDMVGLFERIGDGRWRLVFPRPHFESLLDVVELTPRR
jgi:Domain of unknown function (DUF4893)